MGLSLEVGMPADLFSADPEGADELLASFAAINRVLESAGLPAHEEPRECDLWSGDLFSYSRLHYLRRVAAHLDCGRGLPPPGDGDTSRDRVLQAYYEGRAAPPPANLLGRFFGTPRPFGRRFDHLLSHSDAEGFYLPLDFERVLVAPDDASVPGGLIGSAPRLAAELDRLAEALAIPAELDAESEELWAAADGQGQGEALWQRYGVESYTCVVLREACARSSATGAAIVFT